MEVLRILMKNKMFLTRWACKCFDMKKGGSAKPAEWKFQSRITKWHSLDTQMDLDKTFTISNEDESETLKKQLQAILKNIAASINSALAVIEGEVRSLDDSIEIVGKKKKDRKESAKMNERNSDGKSLQVELYIPCVRIFPRVFSATCRIN